MLFVLALACTPDPASTDDTSAQAGPMEPLFSFALIADTHLDGGEERDGRYRAATEWIEANAQAEGIEIAFLLGDVGWSGGLEQALDVMGGMSVPLLPLLGDNEVHAGEEEHFDEVLGPWLDQLGEGLDGFERAPRGTPNPDWDTTSWFQDYRFRYRDLTFVGLDWVSRDDDPVFGEMATLHDFEGGTFPWFSEQVDGLSDTPDNSVVFLSHHPMVVLPGAFDIAQQDRIDALTHPLADHIYANFAGHFHGESEYDWPSGGYESVLVDAVWDDEVTVRLVSVSGNGAAFEYEQRTVEVE